MINAKKKGKDMFIFICIIIFIVSFIGSAIFKITYKPKWSQKYTTDWNESIGTIYKDISYGELASNKFDMYVPKDNTKGNYGLVVYLHAGGFTSGDKANNQSVYSQSLEIKESIPIIKREAEKLGYHLNEMAISGGSAGGTLAMLYAYRDAKESPIYVKLMFEMVGPSSFFARDWDVYGLDKNKEAAANLFGIML